MTQIPGQYGDFERLTPHEGPGMDVPRRRSILSVLALISAFIVCCPALPLLAVPLGLGGIVSCLVSNGRRKGIFMAIIAIFLGIVFTFGQFAFLEWGFRTMIGDPVVSSLEAMEAGDVRTARSRFSPALNQQLSDDEIAAFGQTMKDRYGSFITWQLSVTDQMYFDSASTTFRVQGEVTFDNAKLPTDIAFRPATQPQSAADLYQIVALTIVDPQAGDLALGQLPGGAPGTGGIGPTPSPVPDPDAPDRDPEPDPDPEAGSDPDAGAGDGDGG